jgi:hypothetical protein
MAKHSVKLKTKIEMPIRQRERPRRATNDIPSENYLRIPATYRKLKDQDASQNASAAWKAHGQIYYIAINILGTSSRYDRVEADRSEA